MLTNTCSGSARGAVVSDLHLFTNRTTVHEHMHAIRAAAEACRLFVFNGDIFDFQWSLHEGFAESVRAAGEWITQLAAAHPHTRFVFVLGNHDSVPAYQRKLESLRQALPNLDWRSAWYRHGDKLFLHGDVYHAGPSARQLDAYRERCNGKLRRSRFRHACYWAFARSGLPAFLLQFVSRTACAKRLLPYLEAELGQELRQVRDIYFGHVHVPFADFRYGNFVFHNTGAATRGMRLSVMQFDLSPTAAGETGAFHA